MIVGDSIDVVWATAVRPVQDAGDRRAEIDDAPTLGASPCQCSADVIRHWVRLVVAPVIDSAKAMGIVRPWGRKACMIIAGADPLETVPVQVVVVFIPQVKVSRIATIVSRSRPAASSSRKSSYGGCRTARRRKRGRSAFRRPAPRSPWTRGDAALPSQFAPTCLQVFGTTLTV